MSRGPAPTSPASPGGAQITTRSDWSWFQQLATHGRRWTNPPDPNLFALEAAVLSSPSRHPVRTDLVNHGYFVEGFVTAFALLDASVQDFVGALLQQKGLAEHQAKELLRSVESERLRRYLELILPVLGVTSPLCDRALASEFRWLNQTRNKLMHAGQRCDLRDAQRGGTAVLAVLRSLNSCGASYVLPASLSFWSPPR
jgi:hypothetical protein